MNIGINTQNEYFDTARLSSTASLQSFSPTENTFFSYLKDLLNKMGYSGEVHRGVFLYHDKRFHTPDFLLPKHLLPIEIDGLIHDISSKKINLDVERDALYRDLGIQCLIIPRDAVYDLSQVRFYLDQIRQLLLQPVDHAARNRLKKKISKGRTAMLADEGLITRYKLNKMTAKAESCQLLGVGIPRNPTSGLSDDFHLHKELCPGTIVKYGGLVHFFRPRKRILKSGEGNVIPLRRI